MGPCEREADSHSVLLPACLFLGSSLSHQNGSESLRPGNSCGHFTITVQLRHVNPQEQKIMMFLEI